MSQHHCVRDRWHLHHMAMDSMDQRENRAPQLIMDIGKDIGMEIASMQMMHKI